MPRTTLEVLAELRGLAACQVAAAKEKLRLHRRCCHRDAVAVLVIVTDLHNTVLAGARPATLAELEPIVAARSPAAMEALRQGPQPGRVLVVLVFGSDAMGLFNEPAAGAEVAVTAPGGSA